MSQAVNFEMRDRITRKLNAIEVEDNMRILFGIESGSDAWGFHAPDSDDDVRFVCTRPTEWHYRLGKKRDLIEEPIDDERGDLIASKTTLTVTWVENAPSEDRAALWDQASALHLQLSQIT